MLNFLEWVVGLEAAMIEVTITKSLAKHKDFCFNEWLNPLDWKSVGLQHEDLNRKTDGHRWCVCWQE